jgi:hypothetical protein
LFLGVRGLLAAILCIVVATPLTAYADAGVGIGTGKIILNETLVPSTTYDLPSIAVYNTGDETGAYEMEVTFNERQPEFKPKAEWVTFSPKRFTLQPQAGQEVSVTITLPKDVQTGNYYAYIEAHGVNQTPSNGTETHITTAAAAKFYFSAKNTGTVNAAPKPTTKEEPRGTAAKPIADNFLEIISKSAPLKIKPGMYDVVAGRS